MSVSLITPIALLLYLTGVLLLFQTRLEWAAELLIALLFSGAGGIELRRYQNGLSGVSRIRVYADGVVRVRRNGQWHAGRVAMGSVVLRRAAWLRVGGRAGGARVDCLCLESSSGKRDWRRFRLIYRHMPSIF